MLILSKLVKITVDQYFYILKILIVSENSRIISER